MTVERRRLGYGRNLSLFSREVAVTASGQVTSTGTWALKPHQTVWHTATWVFQVMTN